MRTLRLLTADDQRWGAVLAGLILWELVAGPVRALTAAATRLGTGDFSASIPPGGPAEVGALAHTMEDMRRNLIELTSTLRRREAEAQAVLVGIVEGVYAVDKNRIIRYLNPQAARLLGGGTPTYLTTQELVRLVQQLRTRLGVEPGLTHGCIEVSPETVDEEKVAALRETEGPYRIFTPDEATDYIRSGRPLPLHPLCGGIPPEVAWRHLELAAAAAARAQHE